MLLYVPVKLITITEERGTDATGAGEGKLVGRNGHGSES
jgi:hypothetical protein